MSEIMKRAFIDGTKRHSQAECAKRIIHHSMGGHLIWQA
jgi:hypothetical protein